MTTTKTMPQAEETIGLTRLVYYASVNGYWARLDEYRGRNGIHCERKLPGWAFDFISIHKHRDGKFSLMSPLCLVDSESGKRPSWERHQFPTHKDAKVAAVMIAAVNAINGYPLHVVNCCSE